MPGPPNPRRDPAQAGSPAAHAVPMNSREVSCAPTGGVKGKKNGVDRSTHALCALFLSHVSCAERISCYPAGPAHERPTTADAGPPGNTGCTEPLAYWLWGLYRNPGAEGRAVPPHAGGAPVGSRGQVAWLHVYSLVLWAHHIANKE